MLDEKVIKESDAIEKHFVSDFAKLKRIPMKNELAEIMIKLIMGKDKFIPENEKPFSLKIIEKRLEYIFTIKIDQATKLFLCCLAQTPAILVMYLTYLQYWGKNNNIEKISFTVFCSDIFPFGFPEDKDLMNLWDKIKVKTEKGTLNLLDLQNHKKL